MTTDRHRNAFADVIVRELGVSKCVLTPYRLYDTMKNIAALQRASYGIIMYAHCVTTWPDKYRF